MNDNVLVPIKLSKLKHVDGKLTVEIGPIYLYWTRDGSLLQSSQIPRCGKVNGRDEWEVNDDEIAISESTPYPFPLSDGKHRDRFLDLSQESDLTLFFSLTML